MTPTDRPMRTWRLPAEVDTDQLAPGATMKFGIEVTARHCLEGVRPDFASGVRRGDVIVAGAHFGHPRPLDLSPDTRPPAIARRTRRDR